MDRPGMARRQDAIDPERCYQASKENRVPSAKAGRSRSCASLLLLIGPLCAGQACSCPCCIPLCRWIAVPIWSKCSKLVTFRIANREHVCEDLLVRKNLRDCLWIGALLIGLRNGADRRQLGHRKAFAKFGGGQHAVVHRNSSRSLSARCLPVSLFSVRVTAETPATDREGRAEEALRVTVR